MSNLIKKLINLLGVERSFPGFSLGYRLPKKFSGYLNRLGILLAGNYLIVGFGFIISVSIANTLGAEGFGKLAYALAISGFVVANIRYGMDRSLTRDLIHSPDDFDSILLASLMVKIAILMVFLGIFLTLFLSNVGQELFFAENLLVIFATVLVGYGLGATFDALELQHRHMLIICIEKAIYYSFIGSIIVFAPRLLNLKLIGYSLLAAGLLSTFLQYRLILTIRRDVLKNVSWASIFNFARQILINNKLLWLAGLASMGLIQANKIILQWHTDYSSLGVFAAAIQVGAIVTLAIKNISRIGMPVLARRTAPRNSHRKGVGTFVLKYVIFQAIVAACFAVPLILFPKSVLELFFVSEYQKGFQVLRIIGFYVILQAIEFILGQYLNMLKMDKPFLLGALIAGLIGLVLSASLTLVYSSEGAAIALLAACAVKVLFYAVASTRRSLAG